jgi:hypothetical protein
MEKGSDICLVVEGSYPYITGGVSSWLQWLMENMKAFTFSIVALIPEEKDRDERKYTFPENVVSYREFVLFDYDEIERSRPLKLSQREWRRFSEGLYLLMKDWRKGTLSEGSVSLLRELVNQDTPGIFRNFLEDETAFALLTKVYNEVRGGRRISEVFLYPPQYSFDPFSNAFPVSKAPICKGLSLAQHGICRHAGLPEIDA